jgi:hypothetical protein
MMAGLVAAEPGSKRAGPLVSWKIFPKLPIRWPLKGQAAIAQVPGVGGPNREPQDHTIQAGLAKSPRPGALVQTVCTNLDLSALLPPKTNAHDDGCIGLRPDHKGRIQIERGRRLDTRSS